MIRRATYRRVLVDSGPLVAIGNASDAHHVECVAMLEAIAPPLLTSWFTIAEAAHLLRKSPASVHELLAGPVLGLFRILPLTESDLPAMGSLLRDYRTLGPQVADISLVHLARREGLDTVFTLDRRDFSVYRAGGGKPFRLLPDISRRPRRRR